MLRHLKGEYGVKDMYVGVPTVIGANGVEKVIEIDLNRSEEKMFQKSIDAVAELCDACMEIAPNLEEITNPPALIVVRAGFYVPALRQAKYHREAVKPQRAMAREEANQEFANSSFLYGGNAGYIEELYARYEDDPGSLSQDWQDYFGSLKDERPTCSKMRKALRGNGPTGRSMPMARLVSALDGDWGSIEKACG